MLKNFKITKYDCHTVEEVADAIEENDFSREIAFENMCRQRTVDVSLGRMLMTRRYVESMVDAMNKYHDEVDSQGGEAMNFYTCRLEEGNSEITDAEVNYQLTRDIRYQERLWKHGLRFIHYTDGEAMFEDFYLRENV